MKKILFLGNSFTYYNDLPAMLQYIVDPDHREYHFDSVLKGSAYLHMMNESDEMRNRLNNKLTWQKWDGVVFQDQSFNPVNDTEDFLAAVKALYRRFDCPAYLYQTWSYEKNTDKLYRTGFSYDEMHKRLKESYVRAAEAIGGINVPVGDAFRYMTDNYPEVKIYRDDHYHPEASGTYLAASLFAFVICKKNPEDTAYPGFLPAEHEEVLREAVKFACERGYDI